MVNIVGICTHIYQDKYLFLMLAKDNWTYFSSEITNKEGKKRKRKLINYSYL